MNLIYTHFVRANAAFELLRSKDFQREWKHLATQSAGFKQMQEADFLTIWYEIYKERFEPIFILSYNELDELVGLIGLAWHKEENYLVHAGNAEYHGWLAREEANIPFLQQALKIIKVDFKVKVWAWNWMPTGLAKTVLEKAVDKDMYLILETMDSPLWDLEDKSKLHKILKSRSNKSKFNRYKRRGNYRFEVITESKRLREVIEIARFQGDFRREAVNNYLPFVEDPFKIDFCSSLVQIPNTLFVNVIWLDNQLLAYHMGVQDKQRVCLGMITYDPSESRQSPGTLLIIELARYLSENGFKYLDLTPGTNSYKDRFANVYEPLHRPTIYFSKEAYLKAKAKKLLVNQLKKTFKLLKVDESTFRKWKTNLTELPSKAKRVSLRTIKENLLISNKQVLYEIDLINNDMLPCDFSSVNQQKYKDLMDYKDNQPFLTRRSLLIFASAKFAKGQTLFSQSQFGQLQWMGWMKEVSGELILKGSKQPIIIEETIKVIHDFYKSPCINQTMFFNILLKILAHVKASGEEKIMLLLDAKDDLPSKLKEQLNIHSPSSGR